MLQETEALVELLNAMYDGTVKSELLEERIRLFDVLIKSAVDGGVIEGGSSAPCFTELHANTWEELKVLDGFENTKELLMLISKFNEDLLVLNVEITKNFQDAVNPTPRVESSAPEMKAQEIMKRPLNKENVGRVLDLLETMQTRSRRIQEVAGKYWSKEEHKANSERYFDPNNTRNVCEHTKKALDEIVGTEVENMKWPFQADPGDNEQAFVAKLMGLISEESPKSLIPAIESFNDLMRALPKFIVRHYIDRLKVRLQYHFSEDEEIVSANRPELILNYVFDQIKTLRQYTEGIGKPGAFNTICGLVIDEIMLILISNYKENSAYLLGRMSFFFMYLEEVSQFQSRLNQHFGYVCDKAHSLFYYILNDRITGKSVSAIWKNLDRKLAEKRMNEILSASSPEMVEQVETLLEHYITSYSTLPEELRMSFYDNAEQLVLTRVGNYFHNQVETHDYWSLLKKSGTKEAMRLDITLNNMIKCLMRQRERLAGNAEVRDQYLDCINDLEKSKRRFCESCGAHIVKGLLAVLKKDIDSIKDQTEKPVKFLQCARMVVDKLFHKFAAAELHKTVEEIAVSMLNAIEKQVYGESWMKVLEKFKKEIIRQQFQEMWMIFAEKVPKIEERAAPWRMKIEQELSK
eukprot:TRINITY_DN1662_c0_g3_i6.p1 TRINITY_DN1662_c0_g3~~TRINITY_DN1662_c0_g3_i6.p1  ORF type:complete len:635 (-),score=200.48 TRINITY_DN1662_c0_g3_i6:147-2051(-)